MQIGGLLVGCDAELAGQCATASLVRPQRRGAVTGGCVGVDQLAVRLLDERIGQHGLRRQVDGLCRATDLPAGGRRHLQRPRPRPAEPGAVAGQPVGIDVGQEYRTRSGQGRSGQLDREVRLTGRQRLVGRVRVAERAVHVDRACRREPVAGRGGCDHGRATTSDRVEPEAEPGDDVAQPRLPVRRQLVAPEGIGEPVERQRPGRQRQCAETPTGERGVDRAHPALADDGDLAEELHLHALIVSKQSRARRRY